MSEMMAVILAAGEGKRMHPLTLTRPKVMLPLANKPLLEHLMIQLIEAGFKKFLFVVGYRSDTVREYFQTGEKWKVNIQYVVQKKQMGTANAVAMVQGIVGEKFFLANGDVVAQGDDLKKVMSHSAPCIGIIERNNNIRDFGVLEVQGDNVVKIHEKSAMPPTNLINAGIYLLDSRIFEAINETPKSARGEYELTDSLQLLIDRGIPVKYYQIKSWLDISYPWDLLTVNEDLLNEIIPANNGHIEQAVVTKGIISIGTGTIIRTGSYLIGPIIIGEYCDIGPNCFIRPYTSIGNKCHIGSAVEVKNSIIMNGNKIPHQNYIGDSIIGENCNLGAGTKIANLRFDKDEIKVKGISTSRKKLGAIIGDNVQTGINVSINTGTMIGNDTLIGPAALAHGIIAPKSRIYVI